jgi:surface antigen
MSSVEDRRNSGTAEEQPITGSLNIPGLVTQFSPSDQLSFPDTTSQPFSSSQLMNYPPSPAITRALYDPNMSPGVTRNLAELETGAVPAVRRTTTSLRQPVVIRSTGKKSSGTMRPPKGRRWVVQLAVTGLLLLIAVVTLITVIPAGTRGEMGFNPFQPIMNLANSGSNNPNLLAQQAATVTAVTQDGYESGKTGQTYAGLPTAPPGTGGYDGFTYGQCTYYADYRYHQLTGFWVPWGGNAWQWAAGASASGWIVSSTPHVPSIIVLQPYVQGAGGYGHVAVVEKINSDGTVYATNWNWYANGGGWARWSSWNFSPGPGVSFVWR